MNYTFVGGFFLALIVVMVFLLIRLWAKDKLERWGYELTRETHNHLRDSNFKLDSIQREQEGCGHAWIVWTGRVTPRSASSTNFTLVSPQKRDLIT
jgi:hypothetical protein